MSARTITINTITRLECHGKIEIFLNEEGNVENAYFPHFEMIREVAETKEK